MNKAYKKVAAGAMSLCMLAGMGSALAANPTSGQMNLTANVEEKVIPPAEPTYSVTVPATLSLGTLSAEQDNTTPYTVKVTGVANLNGGKITASAPAGGNLTSGLNSLAYTNDFGNKETQGNVDWTANIKVTKEDVTAAKAGEYNGTVSFKFAYVAGEATPDPVEIAAPVFSPVAGEVAKGTKVTLTCATPGAKIKYTTNGEDPTSHFTAAPYMPSNGGITVNTPITIKAAAYVEKNGETAWGPVSEAAYTIQAEAGGEGGGEGGGDVSQGKDAPAITTKKLENGYQLSVAFQKRTYWDALKPSALPAAKGTITVNDTEYKAAYSWTGTNEYKVVDSDLNLSTSAFTQGENTVVITVPEYKTVTLTINGADGTLVTK